MSDRRAFLDTITELDDAEEELERFRKRLATMSDREVMSRAIPGRQTDCRHWGGTEYCCLGKSLDLGDPGWDIRDLPATNFKVRLCSYHDLKSAEYSLEVKIAGRSSTEARLIFADWLQETLERDGDEARAELIRIGCAMADTPATVPPGTFVSAIFAELVFDKRFASVKFRTSSKYVKAFDPRNNTVSFNTDFPNPVCHDLNERYIATSAHVPMWNLFAAASRISDRGIITGLLCSANDLSLTPPEFFDVNPVREIDLTDTFGLETWLSSNAERLVWLKKLTVNNMAFGLYRDFGLYREEINRLLGRDITVAYRNSARHPAMTAMFSQLAAAAPIIPCRFVGLTASGRVAMCSGRDGPPPIGVSQEYCRYAPGTPFDDGMAAGSGQTVNVYTAGSEALVDAGGPVHVGDFVEPDSVGRAVLADSSNIAEMRRHAAGIAMESGRPGYRVRCRLLAPGNR